MVNKKKSQNKQPNIKTVKLDISKFTLLRDLVIVTPVNIEGGDLIDPKQYEDKAEFGEIVKFGNKVTDERLVVGKIIRFGKYSSELIRAKGKDYFLVHEEDISGFLD